MNASVAMVVDMPKRAQFRSVELAKRQEVDTWELADAVFEDICDQLPGEGVPSPSSGVNTGLRAAEEVVEAAHRAAGTEVSRTYLRNLFVTVRAWPVEERRPELASFDAHFELRGKAFRNRGAVLDRLAAKTKTGRVSRRQVVVWKSELKPAHARSFLELVERRLRGSLKMAGHPWHTVAEGDRESIAKILRTIANEVENGNFPGKN